MRVLGIILTFGVVLAACSGGAASPTAGVPSAAAPSVAASSAPSVAVPSVAASVAASVAPSASADATNCMAAKPYALLIDPNTDWKSVSAEDREATAKALEAYDFGQSGPNSEYGKLTAALLRDPRSILQFPRLWAGEIKIVACG